MSYFYGPRCIISRPRALCISNSSFRNPCSFTDVDTADWAGNAKATNENVENRTATSGHLLSIRTNSETQYKINTGLQFMQNIHRRTKMSFQKRKLKNVAEVDYLERKLLNAVDGTITQRCELLILTATWAFPSSSSTNTIICRPSLLCSQPKTSDYGF